MVLPQNIMLRVKELKGDNEIDKSLKETIEAFNIQKYRNEKMFDSKLGEYKNVTKDK